MIALNMTENTGQLLSQLSVIDDLSGNSDKFEIMYYYFIYSFCLNEHQQAKSHFEEMYTYAARNPEHREKYRCILTDSSTNATAEAEFVPNCHKEELAIPEAVCNKTLTEGY